MANDTTPTTGPEAARKLPEPMGPPLTPGEQPLLYRRRRKTKGVGHAGEPTSTRNVLSYPAQKAIDAQLASLLRPVPDTPGYVEYVSASDDDEVVAARLSAELGFNITATNVRGLRAAVYGKLLPQVSAADPSAPGIRAELGRALTRLAALEGTVAAMSSSLGESGRLTAPLIERVEHLEERLVALIVLVEKSVVPDPDGSLAKLREKYRVTRR